MSYRSPTQTPLSVVRKYATLLSVAVIFGVAGVIMQVISQAAPASLSFEPEQGTVGNGAVITPDTSASGSKAVVFGSPPLTQLTRGPQSFSSLASARASLKAPADANYVMWNPAWPVNRDLEDVFASLGANDILVLPERPQPYIIDSSEGFRAAGVRSVTGRNGQLPIVSKYKGTRDARTWFAMARAQRGVLGLGPNAVIEMSQSAWKQEPQIQDKGSVSDGWTSPGRYYIGTDGATKSELVGSMEKVLEAQSKNPYFGNFTMRGRDLGGVAYSAISVGGTHDILEHLNLSGAWRGFQPVPNGESGAISVLRATYLISKNIIGTRDSSGKRVGSSPIMINSSPGGRIEDTDPGESVAGMLTFWNTSGKHVVSNVNVRFNYGPGVNLEKTQAGFQLEWIGGSIWSDYMGKGGKTPRPADQGTQGRMHIGAFAEGGSAIITLRGVDIDNGLTPGALNVQTYGNTQQRLSDIHYYSATGQALPVKVYGGSL